MKFANEDEKKLPNKQHNFSNIENIKNEKNQNLNNSESFMKERNRLAYILIAFHQGVSYISQLAIQYFFKDELKVEPSQLATINSITHIPWAIKPILGLITDLLPICGYRRKIYIILCGIINFLCWIFMAFYAKTTGVATAMIFLVNLSLSFCSVLGEAVVVELAKKEKTDKNSKAKDFVSTFFLCRTIGELLSSYLKGLFVDIMPLRQIFFIACFIPLLIVISGFILIEQPANSNNNSENSNNQTDSNKNEEEKISFVNNSQYKRNNNNNYINTEFNNRSNLENANRIGTESKQSLFSEFIKFMCKKYVVIPLAFIIIFKATPSYYDAFFYFITNELKFTASDLGKISFCSTIAILIAIWIYKKYLKDFNFKAMIIVGTVISFIVSFLCYILVLRINLKIGIADFWLLLFTNSFLSLVGELVLLPILSLACVLCPKNLEGTVYSIFMSSLNLGGIFSQVNGSLCTSIFGITSKNYDNLHWFILFAKFLSLAPLPILLCINNDYFEPKEAEEEEKIKNDKTNKSVSNGETDPVLFERNNTNCYKSNKDLTTNNYYEDENNNSKNGNLRNRGVFGNIPYKGNDRFNKKI